MRATRQVPPKRVRAPPDEPPAGTPLDSPRTSIMPRSSLPVQPAPDLCAATTSTDELRVLRVPPALSAPTAVHPDVDTPTVIAPPSPRRALALAFKLNTQPSDAEVSALAAFLAMSTEAVSGWFERRRQLEVWARDIAHELLSDAHHGP